MPQSSVRETLYHVVELDRTPAGRVFDIVVICLIVISLITSSVDTLPDLSQRTRAWLHVVECVTVVLFTIEYLLRAWVSRPRHRYLLSFFGIVDLIAILPFYVALGIDLRSVRAFRLLRMFRILKLARYSMAVRRLHRAVIIAWEEMVLFLGVAAVILFLAATGIYYFEHEAQPEAFKSVFHSLWWAVATLTTVGYGDVYPVTAGGKIFTFLVLIVGLGVVSVPAGLVASALSEARQLEHKADEAANTPPEDID